MRTERLTIRIEPQLKALLEAEAKRTGFSVAQIVRDSVVKVLGSNELKGNRADRSGEKPCQNHITRSYNKHLP